jgi:Holliday junction resolvase
VAIKHLIGIIGATLVVYRVNEYYELQKIDFGQVEQIFSQIPSHVIVAEAKSFALELIEYNKKQLLSLNITSSQTDVQQKRVELIAPVLFDYLGLENKPSRENKNVVVEYDSVNKIISYQNKTEPSQYLKAQYINNKWIDQGSNINESKESEILNKAAPEIRRRLQLKAKQDESLSDKSRKRRRS